MLTWLKKRVHSDSVTAEQHAVQLVYEVFGPLVEDITPHHQESRPAA